MYIFYEVIVLQYNPLSVFGKPWSTLKTEDAMLLTGHCFPSTH